MRDLSGEGLVAGALVRIAANRKETQDREQSEREHADCKDDFHQRKRIQSGLALEFHFTVALPVSGSIVIVDLRFKFLDLKLSVESTKPSARTAAAAGDAAGSRLELPFARNSM
ncbi:MAG: hypothetical protein ACREIF_04065 [Chthoniobacterales bacterium]